MVFMWAMKACCRLVLLARNFFDDITSNFVWCRELYVEYHKKQVAKVDDARVTFELSTVLSKEVTPRTCSFSGI